MPLETGHVKFRGVQHRRYLFLEGKEGQPFVRALFLALVSLLKLDQNCLNEIKVIIATAVNFQPFSTKVRGAAAFCFPFTLNRRWLLLLTCTAHLLLKKLFFHWVSGKYSSVKLMALYGIETK